MLPKCGDGHDPKNYRPITCLSTLYKIFTSIISSKIYVHLTENNLLAPEQNGCRKGTQGCKELLVIDTVLTQQVKKKSHHLSMGWVDYKKAFDSVPHSWLRRVLKLYKINSTIANFLSVCMDSWKTRLHVRQGNLSYNTEEITIKRGIFQGDGLSPLWFCMSLTPLSRMLRTSGYGYLIKRNPEIRISHQFYMDDLKIYASNKDQLQSEFELVKSFSDAVCMEFGLDKCAVVHARRGQIQNERNNLHLTGDIVIQNLGNEDTYKYLGLMQLLNISDTATRKLVEKKVLSRVNKICKSLVSSRNKITAINSWAVPVAVYTFGIIKWSDTALRVFDRKIRTTLTRHRMHHPKSSMERLYLSRHTGGRGLLSLEVMCRQQEERLRNYFLANDSVLHKAICEQDRNYSPLRLAQEECRFEYATTQQRVAAWQAKELHGRFGSALKSDRIDEKSSTEWLRTSGIYGETEGFIFAIQDQVVSTRAYRKHILGQDIDSNCRLCKQTSESIQHVCCGCPSLAQTDYLQRHNNVAKVVHQALAKRYGLTEVEKPYYKCKPEQVLRNGEAKILWDSAINTDRAVEANRPDIVLIDKQARKAVIIDIAVPSDQKLISTVAEKKRKYQPLAVELKDMYKLQQVEVAPVVVSANGLVTEDWLTAKKKLQLQDRHLRIMQKAALLGTANIVRKFLSLE